MSNVVEVDSLEGLQGLILGQSYTIVDFAAESWCVPCQQFKPHFDAVSDMYPGMGFVHVDVDTADVDLLKYFNIQSVPTVLWFSTAINGVMGARTAPALVREIQLLLAPAEIY